MLLQPPRVNGTRLPWLTIGAPRSQGASPRRGGQGLKAPLECLFRHGRLQHLPSSKEVLRSHWSSHNRLECPFQHGRLPRLPHGKETLRLVWSSHCG